MRGHSYQNICPVRVHFAALASIPMLAHGFTIFENNTLSLTQSVASTTNNILNVEQTVGALAARVAALEAGAASASSGSGSPSSWNLLEHSDGSTATVSLGSHGQGSSDDNKNIDLIPFPAPEDEHARSAVLLRFPFEQHSEGISAWINRFWATTNAPALSKPTRTHCKTGSMSARHVFETRAKC